MKRAARWAALACAGLAAGCARGPAAQSPAPATPTGAVAGGLRFEDTSAAAGVSFTHVAGYTAAKLMPEIMGSGVAVADFNRDGAPDLLAVNSGAVEAAARPAGAKNRLFLGDGQGGFRDSTDRWSLPSDGYGMGVAVGDFDGDGWSDVALTAFGDGMRLLRNTGSSFTDVTAKSGIPGDIGWGTSAGFFDADRDGDLDLYVARYLAFDPAAAQPCFDKGVKVYCTPLLYDGISDRLFVNDGGGVFHDASDASGIAAVANNGLALLLADIEPDGDVDAFAVNDIDPNQLWLNDGRGGFTDGALRAGVALSSDGRTEAGMGVDGADVNGDGRLDLAVANFQLEPLSLLRQSEGGLFNDVGDAIGIGPTARQRLKWGTLFLDADNDGDEDIAVAAGHIYDNAAELGGGLTFAQPSLLFQNDGTGRFADVSATAGPPFAEPAVSRGLAVGDLDGDGLLDVVFARNGGALAIARNATAAQGGWVSLWLEGRAGNRDAIGARVTAHVDGRTIVKQVTGASSYLSASDRRVHIGLGQATGADDVTIVWPNGDTQALGPVAGGAFYHVVQGVAPAPYTPGASVIAP